MFWLRRLLHCVSSANPCKRSWTKARPRASSCTRRCSARSLLPETAVSWQTQRRLSQSQRAGGGRRRAAARLYGYARSLDWGPTAVHTLAFAQADSCILSAAPSHIKHSALWSHHTQEEGLVATQRRALEENQRLLGQLAAKDNKVRPSHESCCSASILLRTL